jgi:Barstar (barnase inhibitor)
MSVDWAAASLDVESLSRLDAQWLHVYVEGPAHARALALHLAERGAAARVARGAKARRSAALFDELSAVLQFPDYFGENWSAVSDCVEDLSWLRAPSYVVVWTRADRILEEEPDALRLFLKTMDRAARYWSSPTPEGGESWPHGPRPFHMVLQVAEAERTALTARLAEVGYSFSMLNRRPQPS